MKDSTKEDPIFFPGQPIEISVYSEEIFRWKVCWFSVFNARADCSENSATVPINLLQRNALGPEFLNKSYFNFPYEPV